MPGIDDIIKKSTQLLEDFERANLRELMRDCYICASRCSSDKTSSKSVVDTCVERCFRPLQRAQDIITAEMNHFQERLQRCAQSCQDDIRDKIDHNTSRTALQMYQAEMEKCFDGCCNEHSQLLPKTMDKIKHSIDRIEPPSY